MGKADIYRPYVEKLLKEWLEVDNLIIDSDGDVPIQRGSAMYYVRVLDLDIPLVRLFSPLIRNVKSSPELLEAINDINNKIWMGRVSWIDDTVLASYETIAESLDKVELEQACQNMSWIADTFDTELHDKFGGDLMFEDPKPDDKPDDQPVDV
jgi:hypothetical protein